MVRPFIQYGEIRMNMKKLDLGEGDGDAKETNEIELVK